MNEVRKQRRERNRTASRLVAELLEARAERDRYREALEEIASRPAVERNPDGEDQAAHTMQLIAREALADPPSRTQSTETP